MAAGGAAPRPRRKRFRCRKARLTTACPECGLIIRVGELIASRDGEPFVHVAHRVPLVPAS